MLKRRGRFEKLPRHVKSDKKIKTVTGISCNSFEANKLMLDSLSSVRALLTYIYQTRMTSPA